MPTIRFVDAFAGIGGFHLGVRQACEKLNIEAKCVYRIEKNKPCCTMYDQYFENVPPNTTCDITDITKPDKIDQIPEHDLLVGGFPCQPFSASGLAHIQNKSKINTQDKRSNLYQNLLQIIDYRKPTYLAFENVKGLLTIQNEDGSFLLNTIIEELQGRGYQTTSAVVNAYDFGIPQKRERVIILGSKLHKSCLPEVPNTKSLSLDSILEPDNDIEEKYYLDHQTQWGSLTLKTNPNKTKLLALQESLAQRFTKSPSNKINKTQLAAEITDDTPSGRSRQHDRAYHITGLSPTLTTVDAQIIYKPILDRFRKLTPKEYSRLQGFPDDFLDKTEGLNDHNHYQQFGNAICVPVAEFAIRQLLKERGEYDNR